MESLESVESVEVQIFNKVAELSKEYFAHFVKYFFLIVGFILLLIFYILQSVYYPSVHACYNQFYPLGTMVPYFLTPVFFGLAILLIFFEMTESKQPELDNIAMGTFGVIFVMLLLGGVALFFSGNAKNVNSKIQQILATHGPYPVTDSINKQIKYYYTHLGDKKPVTLCKEFYNDISGNVTCEFCETENIKSFIATLGDYYTRTDQGPRLCDFYVASSYNTCVVKDQAMFYMSEAMIEVALTGGARMLDFEIYDLGYGYDTIPIVTTGAEQGNYHMQHNYLTLESCFAKVKDLLYTRPKAPIVYTTQPNEPVFLNLRLKTNGNLITHQKIANLIHSYFFSNLLPLHRHANIARLPLHQLYNVDESTGYAPYIIICVDGKNLGDLDEYTNIWVNKDEYDDTGNSIITKCQRFSWMDANATSDPEDMVEYNKSGLTFVYPSMDIYSFSKIKGKKDVFEAAQNAKTINNNPVNPLTYGCQFVFLNYQNYDTHLNSYLSFFKNCNFVLKKAALRNDN